MASDRFIVRGRLALIPPYVKTCTTTVYETKAGEVVHIPAGFQCDGSSIPRFLWSLLGHPLDKQNCYPGLLHDWLCQTQDFSAWYSAKLYGEAQANEGARWWKVKVVVVGLWMFGPRW